ncbi:MAG: hypothetical protein DWP94_05270 [Flavobacterium sp.]|nr:MAG: hypothetical protein DWP94_05270 [Flavobacterium sp.]
MESLNLTTNEDISAYYRGKIIQSAILLEFRMDIAIGRYFSSNQLQNILNTIGAFDNSISIGFHAKNLILQYIIKKDFPDFLKTRSTFFSDIDKLMSTRNIVAHKRPDYNQKDYAVLSWSKTSKNSVGNKVFNINKSIVDDYTKLADKVGVMILDLELLISLKAKADKY